MDQAFQAPGRQRIASKAANIAPPDKQVAQARAKSVVEVRCLASIRWQSLDLRHAPFLSRLHCGGIIR